MVQPKVPFFYNKTFKIYKNIFNNKANKKALKQTKITLIKLNFLLIRLIKALIYYLTKVINE